MHYIVFDLEFNQEILSLQNGQKTLSIEKPRLCPFEIIQIGAVKLTADWSSFETFERLVKPTQYNEINPFITELTGITMEQLQAEETFPVVYEAFADFVQDRDAVFCVWGTTDMKELFRNVKYHDLNPKILPDQYINVQPYVSNYLNLPSKSLLKLQTAAELLNIPVEAKFHDALNDARYTAEILKIIHEPSIHPKTYDPDAPSIRVSAPRKKIIDFEALINQFEKMYAREMTEEEEGIIKLAYQMGKTKQFLKT